MAASQDGESGKATAPGDARGAAVRLQVGIDRYGAGDFAGALAAFEEVLVLAPESRPALRYAQWVRDVIAGSRELNADGHADSPQPVADVQAQAAHSVWDPLGRGEQAESPWDPLPLTTPTEHVDELHASAAPPTAKGAPAKSAPADKAASSARRDSSPTLHGMPLFQPSMRRALVDDPESVTREFRRARGDSPTGPNLQPLDVPELSEEQISALLALDGPLLPGGGTMPEYAIDPLGAEDPDLPRLAGALTLPPVAARREDTLLGSVEEMLPASSPDRLTPAALPVPDDAAGEFSMEIEAELPPLQVPSELHPPDEVSDDGTNPTNPFIRGRALAVLATFGTEPKLDDLPPGPAPPSVRGPFDVATTALTSGDLSGAIDASEAALLQLGGLASEAAMAHRDEMERFYRALLGGADRVPRHGAATPDLDPRSAFLLSRLDGAMTVEDVLDVSGMPRLEAMRTLALLLRRGAIVLQ